VEKTVQIEDQYPIRVFLIDAEVVVRAGMRLLIDSWQDCCVVGEGDVAPEAVASLQRIEADLIVLSHGGHFSESAESLVKAIRASSNKPLIVLTSVVDTNVVDLAINAGANGLVLKQDAADELYAAIHAAFSGAVWISESLKQATQPDGSLQLTQEQMLTSREREVAVLVSKGCTDRQVSAQLGVTEGSVRHHLSSIFGKLGIANRFELTAWVYRCRLVTS
jgi:DNA-binding NarL/FixJ family response regulator